MGYRYQSPPGWPPPPEGWVPPPGWAPDPSWPPAPPGWQFWVDEAAGAAEAMQPSDGAPPPRTVGGPPSLYDYAPSGTLDGPAPSPYEAIGTPATGTVGAAGAAGAAGVPPAPARTRATGVILGVGAAVLLAVALVVLLAVNLITGGGDPAPTSAPTDPATTSQPTDDPTDDPTQEPTDDPTPEPTSDPTAAAVPTDGYTVLTGTEPAIINDYDGEPQVEVRLLAVERDWESELDYSCQDATGEQIAVQLEFTVVSQARPYYSFYGAELGLVDTDGHKIADVRGDTWCFDVEEQAPGDLRPDEVVTGWAVLEAPREPSGILWEDRYTYPEPTPYLWLLSDY